MKKFIITTVLATSVLAITACTSKDESEVIVESKLGNITQEEFYQELQDQVGKNVLHNMILEKVLTSNYELTEEEEKEITTQIESLKSQYGDQFDMVLQQNGIRDEDAFRTGLTMDKLEAKAQEAAMSEIEVADEDVQARYDQMKYEVKASHILVDDEETAKELLAKIEAGEDFATLATENSTDTGSAANGGSLGEFFDINANLVPPFKEAAFDLEVDEVSQPVESQFGWHIIKVTDKREKEDVKPFEEMEEEIRQTLQQEQFDPQQLLKDLMSEAEVDIQVEEYKDILKTTEE
jgi:foldase protein PrsA